MRRARRVASSASSPGARSTTRVPIYKVELTWKEGSSNHRATWKVNLEDKTVQPNDVEAQKFMKPAGTS